MGDSYQFGCAIRRGPMAPNGSYFATPGCSTYFDEGAIDGVDVVEYDISEARIADTAVADVAIAVIKETLRDRHLNDRERAMLESALAFNRVDSEGWIDYMLADETPMADAGRRLGYDGIRVWENDDCGSPSSVFIWGLDKVRRITPDPGVATCAGDSLKACAEALLARHQAVIEMRLPAQVSALNAHYTRAPTAIDRWFFPGPLWVSRSLHETPHGRMVCEVTEHGASVAATTAVSAREARVDEGALLMRVETVVLDEDAVVGPDM